MTPAQESLIVEGLRALPELIEVVLRLIESATRGETVEVKVLRPRPLELSPLAQTEPPPPDTARTPAPSLPTWPEEATTAVQVPHPRGDS